MRGRGLSVVLVVAALMVLPACTLTREGSIQLLPDGDSATLSVELDGRDGTVRAVHPLTGEILRGSIQPLEPASMPTAAPPDSTGLAGFEPQPAPLTVGNSSRRSAVTLRGDADTLLECVLSIRRGVRPSGTGTCIDGHGNRYRLRF
jgi:hypothetical protein